MRENSTREGHEYGRLLSENYYIMGSGDRRGQSKEKSVDNGWISQNNQPFAKQATQS